MISYLLYPKVFAEYAEHESRYSDLSVLPTRAFFFGMAKGEEVSIDIRNRAKRSSSSFSQWANHNRTGAARSTSS